MRLLRLVFIVWMAALPMHGGAKSEYAADLDPGKDADTLIVFFHAFTLDHESLKPLRDVLRDKTKLATSDILPLKLPFGMFSTALPADVVAGALKEIDDAWERKSETRKPYQRVILVGHSMGALYARKVYAAACGARAAAPFEPELAARLEALGAPSLDKQRPWADKVDRLVLLAGMNRGWSISHHMSLTNAAAMTVGTWVGKAMGVFGQPPIVFSARSGAPFITQLRLQWLAMRKDLPERPNKDAGGTAVRCLKKPALGEACVIQLLGTVDDMVPPDDNVDLITGNDFIYLDVSRSGHKNVIEMAAGDKDAEPRAETFRTAMLEYDFSSIAQRPVGKIPQPNKQIKDVVFVIHGIRDEGYWTQKIARRIANKARNGDVPVLATETSSYGYFPMLSFLQPGARQEKVEWLMDKYTEAKAEYPDAAFSFVGHSNGTYLLAKALDDYPAVKFKHVVFAGSVVHKKYDWSKSGTARVDRVLNFRASTDWVVAWLPNALQEVGIQDVGSAGHDGFEHQFPRNTLYVDGFHDAALKEDWWDTIATFILTGDYQPPANARVAERPVWWVLWPSYVAWALWLLAAFGLYWLLRGILRLRIREWAKTLAVVGYFALIWTVLTRF